MQFHKVDQDLQTYRTAIEIARGDYWQIAAGVQVVSETGYGAQGAVGRDFAILMNDGTLVAWQEFAVIIDGAGLTAVNNGTMAGRGGVLAKNGATVMNAGEIIVYPSSGDVAGIELGGNGSARSHVTNTGNVDAAVAVLSRGAPVDLLNAGLLEGAVRLGNGSDLIRNVGKIEGEVSLGGGKDLFDGRGGTALSVDGGRGADVLIGGGDADTLNGGRGHDVLRGRDGDDTLIGCYGKDVLKGGAGKDTFVFSNLKGPDTVKDFVVGEDRIHLDNAELKALGSEGPLAQGAFRVGTAAADDDDRVIYDPDSGNLWYDANGDEKGGAAKLAKLSKGLELSHEHFEII